MLYIDFDGVILDTEPLLFEEWRRNPNHRSLPEFTKIKYIQKCDWNYIINNSNIINDSIYYLKQMNPKNTFILTKIHSQKEGNEKTIWLRKNGVLLPVILVPYKMKKVDIAYAKDNILVDDCLKNLKEWKKAGGNPIFFDMNDDGYDSWQQPNIDNYKKVLSLSKII